MTILEKIVKTKKEEVIRQKKNAPVSALRDFPEFERRCLSLKSRLLDPVSSGIIAEFKQKSPSKGEINFAVKVENVTRGYTEAGAAGLSVLTDFQYFGGTPVSLAKAREANRHIPILRKDFIIDPYQVTEAKAYGADAILLIAACLRKKQAEELAIQAGELGMDVLMEIHEPDELEKLNRSVDMIGVNNRNLKTFKVNVETSVQLAGLIPGNVIKISESGLTDSATIHRLQKYGYKGFLIGETFMKTKDPAEACRKFIESLKADKAPKKGLQTT